MSRHRGGTAHHGWLLLGALVVIAGMLLALFRLADPGADVTHATDAATSAADATVSDVPSTVTTTPSPSTAPPARIQGGRVVRPVPKPKCSRVPVDTSITVLTYNIKSGQVSSLAAIAGVIRSSGADVALLQEVDRNRHGSGQVDQPAQLAGMLGGWSHTFGQNVSYGSGGYGTAIVSRFPITSSANTHLPNGPGGQQRGLLRAVVDIGGMDVSLYSTHLQNKLDHLKLRQAQAIAPIVAADGNPKVLGGDMNAWPGDSVLSALKGPLDDTWDAVGAGAGATNPAPSPRGRIDYLLYAGGELTPTSANVPATLASDHRPVRATYSLSGVSEKRCEKPRR
jgi:endonuclease/exonuclease/phosphatase family metal-dependent hydrolase